MTAAAKIHPRRHRLRERALCNASRDSPGEMRLLFAAGDGFDALTRLLSLVT